MNVSILKYLVSINRKKIPAYIKSYMLKQKSRLPENYQEVEYIESTGVQYILTSIIPNNEMGVYMKLSSNDVNGDLVYAGAVSSNNKRYHIFNYNLELRYGWNTNYLLKTPLATAEINDIELNYMNSRKAIYNRDTISDINSSLDSQFDCPIAIFAGNNNGTVKYKSKIKLYELKISEGANITFDFIPCYRKSDNEVGMYDLVNNIFYTNDGTGSFIAGGDV